MRGCVYRAVAVGEAERASALPALEAWRWNVSHGSGRGSLTLTHCPHQPLPQRTRHGLHVCPSRCANQNLAGARTLTCRQGGQRVSPPPLGHASWPPKQLCRPCLHVQRGNTLARRQSCAADRGEISLRAAHATCFAARWYSTREEDEAAIRVTVTSATLFTELMRLFPCSAAYSAWRQNIDGSGSAIAASGSVQPWPASPARRAGPHSDVTHTRCSGGYDWRLLYLVRCTPPSLRCPPAARNGTQRVRELAEAPAQHDAGTCGEAAAARSFDTPAWGATDEGRAAYLWGRYVLSMYPTPACAGARESEVQRAFHCWPRPATYALYYTAADAPASTPDRPGAFGGSPRAARGACRGGWKASVAEANADLRAAEALEVRPEDWQVVGCLYAIPGLPQPPPIALASLPPVTLAAPPAKRRDCVAVGASEVMFADAAVHDASHAALLTGSVCSLHDYHCQLCGGADQTSEGGRDGSTPGTSSPRERLSTPPQRREEDGGRRPGAPVAGAVRSGHAGQGRAPTPAAPFQFPFPDFFSREVTPRGSGRCGGGDRWGAPLDMPSDPLEGPAQHAPPPGGLGSLQQRLPVPAPERCLTLRLSGPRIITSDSPNKPHWRCVPASDFLQHFAHLHALQAPTAVVGAAMCSPADAVEGVTDPSSSLKPLTLGNVGATAPSTAAYIARNFGVGVLLVHERQWIYFQYLCHTHPVAAAFVGGRETGTHTPADDAARPAAAEGTAFAHPGDHARSAYVSHCYCFLHPPCQLSMEDMEGGILAADPATAPPGAAPPPPLPCTWLVHLSADVKWQRLLDKLLIQSQKAAAGRERRSPCDVSHMDAATPGVGDTDAGQRGADPLEEELPHAAGPNCGAEDALEDCTAFDAAAAEALENERREYEDDLCSDTHRRAAANERSVCRAYEVELLRRYLRHTMPHQACRLPPQHTCQRNGQTSAPLSSAAGRSTSAGAPCNPRIIAVSPFPRSTDLLRNRLWFTKPFTLAEEMRYGTVVKYGAAELAVPRAHPCHVT